MAEVTISNLPLFPVNNPLLNSDVFPIVNNSVTQRVQYNTLYNDISSRVVVGKYVPIATYNDSQTFLSNVSGNWQSTYTTVSTFSGSWGAGAGLTLFREVSSNISPNDSTNVYALSVISLSANVAAALIAKGTGATLAQIPDNTATGGGTRGQYATDFQKIRAFSIRVASGDYSTIGGGSNNTAGISAYATVGGGYGNAATGDSATIGGGNGNSSYGSYSTVGGGVNNIANDQSSTVGGGGLNSANGEATTVGGGRSNTASGIFATVGGGNVNTANGPYSTVGGGRSNTASGQYATVGGGAGNTASGAYSTIVGGYSSIASGNASTVVGGFSGRATNYGQLAYNTGYFSLTSPGDSQMSTFLLRTTTSSAVSTVCTLDGPSGTSEITMLPSETMFVTATIACLSSQETGAGYFGIIKGVARCNAAGNVTIYNQDFVSVSRGFSQPITTFNAGLSALGDKLRVVVYANSTRTFKWNAKLETLSINGA